MEVWICEESMDLCEVYGWKYVMQVCGSVWD